MSEIKFTPAPWSVEFFSDMSQVHVYSSEHDYTLHHHKKFFGTELTETDIANSNLIACAPEIYAMLDSVRQCLEWGYTNAELADNLLEYREGIANLLAKARGEA